MKKYCNVPHAVYKSFFTKNFPNFFDEIYVPLEINVIHTRSSYQRLIVLHEKKKKNGGQKVFYIDQRLWKNLNTTLKTLTSLNALKHNIIHHCFNELEKKES